MDFPDNFDLDFEQRLEGDPNHESCYVALDGEGGFRLYLHDRDDGLFNIWLSLNQAKELANFLKGNGA